MNQTWENGKISNFGSVTRYHGQLSSCAISTTKTATKKDQSWQNLVTDRRTDECDFIGRYPTKVERPTEELKLASFWVFLHKNKIWNGPCQLISNYCSLVFEFLPFFNYWDKVLKQGGTLVRNGLPISALPLKGLHT